MYMRQMALLETAGLREAIAASRRDPRPAIPAEQMFAELDAAIDQVVKEQAAA
jgi:antitoxin StbD